MLSLQSIKQNEIVKYRLKCGRQEIAKELYSGIEIVHGWFTERRFYSKSSAMSEVTVQITSLSAIAN